MEWSREFPSVGAGRGAYLNSCSYGLLPRRTRAAIERHLARWESAPDWDVWSESVAEARKQFARLIGAREDEIAVQANASSGIAAVMNAIQPVARRRIVTLDIDFPTAPFLAERQRTRGFAHTHLRAGDGILRASELGSACGRDTALACIPAVASFNGYRLDVKAFAEAAHAHGAPLLVDAFQAAGTYPIDVKKLDVDFLVTGVYKWLLAPVGLAFLYVRRDHHALLPTTSGWYGAAEPYSFDPLQEPAPDARRFEYGGGSVIGCVAAAESLALVNDVGPSTIEASNRKLVERVMDGARERKLEVLTPQAPEDRASIVTFRVPELGEALGALKREGIAVSSRIGGIRVAPHFYNSARDVDRLFEVLDGVS